MFMTVFSPSDFLSTEPASEMAAWLGQQAFVRDVRFCFPSRQPLCRKLQRIQARSLRCSLGRQSPKRSWNEKRIIDRDALVCSASSNNNSNANANGSSESSTAASKPLGTKRTDIQKILVLGAGPIVIGQACEFDYSGTQACKVRMQEFCAVSLS